MKLSDRLLVSSLRPQQPKNRALRSPHLVASAMRSMQPVPSTFSKNWFWLVAALLLVLGFAAIYSSALTEQASLESPGFGEVNK